MFDPTTLANFTKNYYEVHAYDYFCATHAVNLQPLWNKLINQLRSGARVLDLGCGSGRDLLHLSHNGLRVVGIDYSFSLLKLASAFSRQPLVLSDFITLPFKDNVFDAVWAIGSLLHVPRPLVPLALAQIHRVLKANSVLFTSVKKGHGESFDHLGRYNVFYSQDEWEATLTSNGYECVSCEEMIEIREASGWKNEVEWIVCLAKRT